MLTRAAHHISETIRPGGDTRLIRRAATIQGSLQYPIRPITMKTFLTFASTAAPLAGPLVHLLQIGNDLQSGGFVKWDGPFARLKSRPP
jgi:hypothetical protein